MLKYDNVQNISLTPYNKYIERLSTSSRTEVTHFLKWSGFLAHPAN